MMAIGWHVVPALLILTLVLFLLRRSYSGEPGEESGATEAREVWSESFLSLSEIIFDRGDYLWLRDKVGLPRLARALARSRQQMALRWLRALRRSFDDLVRLPEPLPAGSHASDTPRNWHMLWLTLRFHLLLGYALFVVSFFGPYHRLLPSLGWMHSLSGLGSQEERPSLADTAHL